MQDKDIEKLKRNTTYTVITGETSKELRAKKIAKCVQVLKYIISKHPDPDIYNVLKTLYLADREHLKEKYELIVPDKYIKMQYGPVPSLCFNILQFVRGTDGYYYIDDESIKKEIEVYTDDRPNKLKYLTEPDLNYLLESNIKCLDEAIEKYGNYTFSQLKNLTHDEIYNSVPNLNEEITIFHMAKYLDKTGDLLKRLHELYYEF